MHIEKATFIGYAYDASYYINGDASSYDENDEYKKNADAVIAEMQKDYGPSARIVDCSSDSFFGRPDYGMQLQGDCVEYTIFCDPTEM